MRAVVLVLHGGQPVSHDRAHGGRLAYLRMLTFRFALHRAGRDHGLAVWMLRYRFRGWNEPAQDPVRDAEWALRLLRQRHSGVPVVLVGHSMGGRVALRVAGDPAVIGVCALAPWIEPDEPVGQLADRTVLIAHGDQERVTDPEMSYSYAVRAKQTTERVGRFEVLGDGHAMLRRAAEWTGLVRRFALGLLGIEPEDRRITDALRAPAPDGLRVPLVRQPR